MLGTVAVWVVFGSYPEQKTPKAEFCHSFFACLVPNKPLCCFFFFNYVMSLNLFLMYRERRERERVSMGEGKAKRETESQAGSTLSVQSPMRGSKSRTVRS